MTITCNYCGNPAQLVTGAEIYPHRTDLKRLSFWSCSPCAAYVGCHKDSDAVPLGRLANAELRRAKNLAHAAFDPIWKEKRKSRSKAYSWLAHQLKIKPRDCHIGMFDIDMCNRVIAVCAQLKDPQ